MKENKSMANESKKILIVEDEQSLLKTMEFTLQSAGFEVVSASEGESAVGMVKDNKPDLVLLDIILPKKSGIDVLKELKADGRVQHIPVVMLNNLSDEKSISEAIGVGERGYFVKSDMTLDDLVVKVKEILPGS